MKGYLCRQSWHFSPVELRYCTVYLILWFQSINSPVRRKAKFLGQSPWSWSNALGSGDVRPGRRGVASLPLRRGRTGRFGLTLFIGIVFSPMSWISYTFHTLWEYLLILYALKLGLLHLFGGYRYYFFLFCPIKEIRISQHQSTKSYWTGVGQAMNKYCLCYTGDFLLVIPAQHNFTSICQNSSPNVKPNR